MSWLSNPNANRFKNIYLQGFLNISGGDVNLQYGNLTVNGSTILNNSLNSYSYDNANFNSNFGKNWINIDLQNSSSIQQSISISANGQYQVFTQNNNSGGNVILSNKYGNTWRDTGLKSFDSGNFQHVAISKNGKYILILFRPPTIYINSGSFYLSSDYGTTWINPPISIYGYPQSVSISYDGKYQNIVTSNNDPNDNGYIYISNDYGNTWSQKISLTSGFQSVAISATGKYQTAVPFSSDNIWYSINYGKDWRPNSQTVDNTNTTTIQVPFLNNSLLTQTICISYDGKYQTTFGINNGNILINKNYGAGIWSDSNINPGGFFSGISLSSTGQYQVIGSYNISTSASIYISTNYGQTWNQNSLFVNYQPSNSSYYFNSVFLSSNGDYITTLTNYFDNNNNFISGNIYTSSIQSSITPLIKINTFGTPTSGNVFTHPLAITVPNSLNSGLYLGYDIGNNHGYINSLNLEGSTNMCLQSQGGFIGIGNSFPKFTLDISGEVNISGNLYSNTISLGNSSIKYSTISGYSNASSGLLINSDNIMVNPTKNGNIFLQPNGGKIGIGKYSADYTLDICGTVNITNQNGSGLILNSTNIQTYGSGYGINLDGVSNRTLPSSQILAIDVLSNTTDLIFKTATYSSSGVSTRNIERMRISNSGTIGIGITTPSSNYIADISGALRVNLDTGVNGSTTTGTIVLCHSNNVNNITNGSSTILYKNTLYDSNYSSITYYDSVSNISTYPSYGYLNSSVLTIDSNGNSTTNNIVLRANGYIIVDTYFNTYFINGVSIGTSTCTPNYLLDVSGDINTININSIGVTTNTLLTTGNIDISNANINAIWNCSINGFLIRSPEINADLITVTELDVTNINITNSVNVQSILVSDFINISSTIDSSNIHSGSFVTNGGIGCAKSLYIGDTLYTDNIMSDNGTISIQYGGTINMDHNSKLSAVDSEIEVSRLYVKNDLTMESGSAFNSDSLFISNSGIITTPSPLGDIDCSRSVLNAGLVNITDTCTFSPESIVILQNTASSSNIMTGALTISGGVGIGENVNIGGSVNIGLDTNIGNSLYVYNRIIGNAITANNGLTVNNNSLVVNFGMRMNGSLNQLYCQGIINCTNSTSSKSTTTGALTVIGGIGIGGDINIGGFIKCNEFTSFNNIKVYGGSNPRIDFYDKLSTQYFLSGYQSGSSFDIGTTLSSGSIRFMPNNVTQLQVSATAITATPIIYANSGIKLQNTGSGFGITWGNNASNIYDDGNLYITTDDVMYINAPISLTITSSAIYFTGNLFMNNANSFYAKNSNGNYEQFLWPRYSDNITYLNYGSGGFNIRNNSSISSIFITNNNNVGIGTSSPGYKLDVNGNSGFTGLITANGGLNSNGITNCYTTGSTMTLHIGDNAYDGSVSYGSTNMTRTDDLKRAHLAFIRNGNFVWQFGYIYNGGFTSNFGIFNWNFTSQSSSGSVPVMSFFTGGGVGINRNTLTSGYMLDVNGSVIANSLTLTNQFTINPPAISGNPIILSINPNLTSNTNIKINTVAGTGAYNLLAVAGDMMVQYSSTGADTGGLIICPWSNYRTGIRMTSGSSGSVSINGVGGIYLNNNTSISGLLTTNNNDINAGTGTVTCGALNTSKILLNGSAGSNGQVLTSTGVGPPTWSNISASGFAPINNPTFTGTVTAPLLVANSQSFLFPNVSIPSGGINNGGFGFLTGNYNSGHGECDFVSTYSPDTANRLAFSFLKQKTGPYSISTLMTIDNGGNITASTYNATSDYRIKENVKQITATIDDLKPVQYYNKQTKKEDMGFIAHEIQEQFPFLVTGEKDAKDMQNLNYIGIIALLTKELQDLKTTVKSLQTKIEILEST
jgi:hypothetical protein